jgi:VanZ family protein
MTLRSLADGRTVRVLFWAAAIFAFVMAVLPHPPRIPGEPNDKIQHIAAFATLALLGSWAYTRTTPWKLLLRLSLFGAAIEIIQLIPALNRDSDVIDWLADTIAVLVVLALIRALRRGASASPASD